MRGGLIVFGTQAIKFPLRLAAMAVLARLLAPPDFGLVAMVLALTDFLMLFSDLGLSTATVQREQVTQAQVSTLFWVNVAVGLAIMLLAAASAPLLALFYAEPRVIPLTLVLSTGFVIVSLSMQHRAMLRRQMRFKALARVDVVALVCGLTCGIAAALLGAGYWALVYTELALQGAYTLGVWLSTDWRPGPPARGAGVRPMLAFGGNLLGFNVANYVLRNADAVLLGRAVGSAALGLYSQAYRMLLLPVRRISDPVSSIAVPTLSRLQKDPQRFRSFYLKAMLLICAAGMPAVVFLFVMAEDAILLILGDKWGGSVVLFQALGPAAFVGTFNVAGSWVCLPLGWTGRLLRWQVLATTVTVAAFAIAVRWGALGMAVSVSITSVALRLPAVLYLLRDSPVRPVDLLGAIARPAVTSILAGAGLAVLDGWAELGAGRAVHLALGLAVYGALYAILWNATPGGRRALRMTLNLAQELRRR